MSCAQIRSPQGGDKDETPPQIENMIPRNYSTNFAGTKLMMEFDEYVTLKNIQEQLLVSPPLLTRPEISIKGKSVIIEIQEKLEENTTYTFNFGDGVVDINEGNPLDSNTIVFSTGSFLDSLSIKGKAMNAYSQLPANCGILLHRSLEDSAIVNDRPQYFARTDERGYFELNNLRDGEYRIYAISDQDKNYKWTENEMIGYLDSSIMVFPEDSTIYNLELFMQKPSKQFIKNYKSFGHGKAEFVLNLKPKNLDIRGQGFQFDSLYVLNYYRKDSISCWFENIRDLEDPELILTDGEWADTLGLGSFDEGEKTEVPLLELQGKMIIKQNPRKTLDLSYNSPLKEFDKSKMIFRFDTVETNFEIETLNPLTLELTSNWSNARNANLYLFPEAVKDIYGQTNDTTLIRIKVLGKEDHSELLLGLNCEKLGNYIIELFEGERVEKTELFSDSTQFSWNWLSPGEYQIRVIEDINQNGLWDTGEYFERRQPEPVAVFNATLQLRPNWLLEQSWDLKFE